MRSDFIYLENQYFWLHAYYGIDIPFLGRDSPEMERNIRELGLPYDVVQQLHLSCQTIRMLVALSQMQL